MIDLNQVNIMEDIIPTHFQEHLYNKLTKKFSWVIHNLEGNTTFQTKDKENKFIHKDNNIYSSIKDGFQFFNVTLNSQDNYYNVEDLDLTYLTHYLQVYLDYKYKLIPLRLKSNLQTPQPENTPNHFNTPHIDHFTKASGLFTMIYYVNDSDGDTIVFNESYYGYPIKEFTLHKKITPKKGLMVMFPTNTFHCGSHPINSKARIVINLNFQLIPL